MSSSNTPTALKAGSSSTKPGVGSRKAHHALSQQKLDGFFSPTPQQRSATPSSSARKAGQASGKPASNRKATPSGSSSVAGVKKTAVSAFQAKDRGRTTSPSSTPVTSRKPAGPSSVASGSKTTLSLETRKRHAANSVSADEAKGKGKARQTIDLSDDDIAGPIKPELDCSDVSEDDPIPVKKKRRLSALPRPGPRQKEPRRPSRHNSSSPSSSPPEPQRRAIAALPPERKPPSYVSRTSEAPPSAALHPSSSPPQDPDPLPPGRPVRSDMRSSPPELSASLAPYLPVNHPSPPQLFRPKNSQALAQALSFTGLRNTDEDHVKWLRRERFVYESDADFDERKAKLKLWEAQREQDRISNSMRPSVRKGMQPGGSKDAERQRVAEEAEKDRIAKAKIKEIERQRSRELSKKRSFGAGESELAGKPSAVKMRPDSEEVPRPRIQSTTGPTSAFARQPHQRSDQSTPTPSSSRPRPLIGSRPRHNPSSLPRPSTAPVKIERDQSPLVPPPAPAHRPIQRVLSAAETADLTESQFEPIPDCPLQRDPSPPPSPPSQTVMPPKRPPIGRPPSDETGESSQWSIVDYYHPDARSNPFLEPPIPLADLLPVNPTIAGMDIPEPEEYETQDAIMADGLPESQWNMDGSSLAGWSAFEAAHVHRPGGVFQPSPSRTLKVERATKGTGLDSRVGSGGGDQKQGFSSETQPSSSSQTQDEGAGGALGTSSIKSSRVLVVGTPSPKASPSKQRTVVTDGSPLKPVLVAQRKQHILLRHSAPSSPSSGPSSEESIAFVGLSPGSIPVRPFIVAKDSSSSGPESAGTLELLALDLTPKAKEARKWMQNEVDPSEGVKSDKAFRGDSAKKKLVEILHRAGSSRSTTSRSGSGGSPGKPLMGPPAPPSPTSPRKSRISPSKSLRSPATGSPLRPRPAASQSTTSTHLQHLSESDDDDDEIVPDSQSQLLLPHAAVANLKKPVFQPILSPIPASGSVAPSSSAIVASAVKSASKPKLLPFGIFSGFPDLPHDPEDDIGPAAAETSASVGPSRPPPPVLNATKLEEFGFTHRRDRKPVNRDARPEDEMLEDVEASDDDDGVARVLRSVEKGKGREEDEHGGSSPFLVPGGGRKSLGRVPSPLPLHALKPTPILRRRKASERRTASQDSLQPPPTPPESVRPQLAADDADSDSDSSSVVVSSQTQMILPTPRQPQRRRSSQSRVRPHPSTVLEEDEDEDDRVPSSQATQDFLSHRQRSDPDRGYETDNDDEVVRSSQKEEWSPISFSARERAEREGRRVYFLDEEDGEEEEEEDDSDRTITAPPVLDQHLLWPSSATIAAQEVSSSSSSGIGGGGGLGTPLRLMEEARERLRAALASSSSDEEGVVAMAGVIEEVQRQEEEKSSSLTSLSDP